MCVSLQRRACKNMEMSVSLQWRAQNVKGMGGGVCVFLLSVQNSGEYISTMFGCV